MSLRVAQGLWLLQRSPGSWTRCIFCSRRLGPTSTGFKNRIFRTTREATTTCTLVCVFTTRRMLSTCNKDVLPAVELSNVIYLFNCACGHGYVGRTSQWLEERIRQHVPVSLVAKATCHQQQEPAKKTGGDETHHGAAQPIQRSSCKEDHV